MCGGLDFVVLSNLQGVAMAPLCPLVATPVTFPHLDIIAGVFHPHIRPGHHDLVVSATLD